MIKGCCILFRFSDKAKRVVAILIVVFFAVLAFSTLILNIASADTESDLKKQQQDLNSSKNDIKNEINNLNSQKDSVLAEKAELDTQVSELESEISDLNSQIGEYQDKIDVVSVELDEASKAAEEQYEAYRTRVRVMYESGSTGYLDILLSSENISDFFERLEIVKQITAYDSTMTENLKNKQQEIQTKKDELESLKQGLVDSRTVIEGKKTSLDAKMAQRDSLIREIEGSVESLEEEIERIEKEQASVRAKLANLSGSSTPYSGGVMTWPSPSCHIITSNYGWRLHPTLGYEKLHTGMDIGAAYGSKIVAAKSGTVVTATYNSAYGNYVVINHGGGVCTLYAHQSSLAVSAGQYVNEGDVIGYVGSTGYSTGPHLHFEVIINGVTTDPLGYVS